MDYVGYHPNQIKLQLFAFAGGSQKRPIDL